MGVSIAVTRVAANTSLGTQDITTGDLGGLTPKAVLLIATRGTTDGTAVDGASFYMGVSDGTNEWTQGYEEQHAVASMNSFWNQDTTANRILTIYDGAAGGSVESTANFDSFIADGVRIDWTDAPGSAWLITAILFAGTDLTVNAGTQDLGNTGDAAIDITTVGFEADIVIAAVTEDSTLQQPTISLGFAHNDRAGGVTQRGVSFAQRDTFSSSAVVAQMRDGEFLSKTIATGGLDWTGAAGSFDSSGFTVQLGGGRTPGNCNISWLALRLGASPVVSAKVYTYSTPTSTGANTDNTPNFEPQFVMYLANRAAVADTIETDADAGTVGVVLVDADEVYTQSNSTEDGAADSNAQSLSDDILNLPTHTGAAGHQATLTSMGSTGPVWNYSSVDATARLFGALAIQKFTEVGGSIAHPIFANDDIHGVIFGGQVVN